MLRESSWKLKKRIGLFELTAYNAVYFEDGEKYLVVGDLHLGMEEALRLRGISIPRKQIKDIKYKLKKLLEMYGSDVVIILNGDIKHEFSELTYGERKEINELISYVVERFKDVVVIRGNHDNYVVSMLERKGIVFRDYYETPSTLIFHGHKEMEITKHVVVSHEHPAISLRDDVGATLKLDAFLVGTYKGKSVVVLPAFSSYSAGSDVIRMSNKDILNPTIQKVGLENFEVYATYDDEVLYFGKVGTLKSLFRS